VAWQQTASLLFGLHSVILVPDSFHNFMLPLTNLIYFR